MTTAPAASTAASTLTPGSGSARRAVPIGISGDAATARPAAATAPAAAATPTCSRPAAISWPQGHPQRRQNRVGRLRHGQQPRGGLPHHEKRGDGQHEGEERQRDCLGADRPFDRHGLGTLVGHEHVPPGGAESLCERFRLVADGARAVSRPQLHISAIESGGHPAMLAHMPRLGTPPGTL